MDGMPEEEEVEYLRDDVADGEARMSAQETL